MKFRSLIAAAALSGLAAPVLAQPGIQELADRWVQAYNVHDTEALAGLYTDDARLMLHGQSSVIGRDDIASFWARDFTVDDPLTLLTVTHSVNGADMILVHGDYRVIGREDGASLAQGRFSHLWVLDDRQWRLERDLWNQPWEPYAETSADMNIQLLADHWVEAYNQHDRDELESVYEPDAALMMHGAPTIAGRNSIGAFWAQDFEAGNPLTLLTVTHAVDGIDMALVHGNYEVVDRDSGELLGLGRFAHIWFMTDDGDWQLDRDIWIRQSMRTPFASR